MLCEYHCVGVCECCACVVECSQVARLNFVDRCLLVCPAQTLASLRLIFAIIMSDTTAPAADGAARSYTQVS